MLCNVITGLRTDEDITVATTLGTVVCVVVSRRVLIVGDGNIVMMRQRSLLPCRVVVLLVMLTQVIVLKELVSSHMGRMIYVRVGLPGPVCTDIVSVWLMLPMVKNIVL